MRGVLFWEVVRVIDLIDPDMTPEQLYDLRDVTFEAPVFTEEDRFVLFLRLNRQIERALGRDRFSPARSMRHERPAIVWQREGFCPGPRSPCPKGLAGAC